MTDAAETELGTARATPSKSFFVNMLTRDIALEDAVLDLLDNCLDGILRSHQVDAASERPYEGFQASITMCPDHFIIEDNCGGIPIDIARRYAFAMGRPSDANDPTPDTIGLYGIGMKRAIFKLGKSAIVESDHDTGFRVEFTQQWMNSDEWDDLPLLPIPDGNLDKNGTKIAVFELNQEVSNAFGDPEWIAAFKSTVSQHYSLIISKGLKVFIGNEEEMANGVEPVSSESFQFLKATPDESQTGSIEPYMYIGEIEGVRVEIFAGLYRKLLSAEEEETEEATRGTKDDAGWTVACNDRIVIWKDKSRLTGWGEATVPNYHGQFIPITGIVLLYSHDVKKLPLTTTKRGIDASSNVYSTAKDLVREATKELTRFTNRWKKYPEEREKLYKTSNYVSVAELRSSVAEKSFSSVRKIDGMTRYAPSYPMPPQDKTTTRISYTVDKADLRTVAQHLFDTTEVTNEEVGRKTFTDALERAGRAAE